MDSQILFDKIELTELTNKLFMYTDALQWDKLLAEVFVENIWFDMQSANGEQPVMLTAEAICDMWKQGFAGLDSVHHQSGHYLINVNKNDADIYGYAVATHFKRNASKGNTRTFTGSYDLKASRTAKGWRLTQFKYNLKYMDGNIAFA